MELKTRGFALSSRVQGETDRWVRFLTLHAGLVRASVRGVRKQGSKLASSLELMTESDLVFHRKGGSDFLRLTQAKVLSGHPNLKRDLSSISALQVLADVLGQSLPDGEAHPEGYALVLRLLKVMGDAKGAGDRERLLAAFTLQWLELLGYPLELSRCAGCGGTLSRSSAALVPHRGGVLCPECAPASAPLRLTAATRATAEKMREWPIERTLVLKAGSSASRTLFRCLMGYLEQTLEHPLRSLPYYLQVVPAETGGGRS
jgi:DNA repair protein RecO